jgi:hypothetical protein
VFGRRLFGSIGYAPAAPSNVCQAARNNRVIGFPVGGPRWVAAPARPVAEVLLGLIVLVAAPSYPLHGDARRPRAGADNPYHVG